MNNQLINRVDGILQDHDYLKMFVSPRAVIALYDCRAEIERLESRIAELEKPYVPFTNFELYKIWRKPLGNPKLDNWKDDSMWKEERRIEAETIKRYNEQRGR